MEKGTSAETRPNAASLRPRFNDGPRRDGSKTHDRLAIEVVAGNNLSIGL